MKNELPSAFDIDAYALSKQLELLKKEKEEIEEEIALKSSGIVDVDNNNDEEEVNSDNE